MVMSPNMLFKIDIDIIITMNEIICQLWYGNLNSHIPFGASKPKVSPLGPLKDPFTGGSATLRRLFFKGLVLASCMHFYDVCEERQVVVASGNYKTDPVVWPDI